VTKYMGDFDIKIWLKKLAKGLGLTLLSTGLIYVAGYIELSELPAEYAFWGGLTVIALAQIGNYIKHQYLVY